jgi:very-short-patch-repair endonuclease
MHRRWTDSDLRNLQSKGLLIEEQIKTPIKKLPTVTKESVGKNTIELLLQEMKRLGVISGYVHELKFDDIRRYRFDWAIPDLKLAIEYEGLNSEKSRHTTKKGYTGDCQKYNLAVINGWKVLRYTAMNYSDFAQDIKVFLRKL